MKCTITIEISELSELKALFETVIPEKKESKIIEVSEAPEIHVTEKVVPGNTEPEKPVNINSKTCRLCQKSFVPTSGSQIYCSKKCTKYIANQNYRIKHKSESKSEINHSQVSRQEQDRKLKELKEKYPISSHRPLIQRDFSVI